SKIQYSLFEEPTPGVISLFSGGLDSLIGTIDWLEKNPKKTIKLVGHYDPNVAGPKSDQNGLLNALKEHYKHRINFVQVRVGQTPPGKEVTFRSRSIVFIGLGIYVASLANNDIDMMIPENGNIALNVPLTPSRRGSCSTRTAHPFFLKTIDNVLNKVGFRSRIINPLCSKTKGECVDECLNRSLLTQVINLSVSCAKRGHKKTWIRKKDVKQCGRCMPCIYRRAALHKISYDNEIYGMDICNNEVDLESTKLLADDFRSYVSLMSNNPTPQEISAMLLANGNLDIDKLPEYGDVVFRALEEIRSLLRDKATPQVLKKAGIQGGNT
ncbi:MAG: hypothetical protein D3908_00165, partial [Candidatus Electrothrix sp. AUS4]|nr:hypothetical protein [Candidatus Electrothrix sp. AUS4]